MLTERQLKEIRLSPREQGIEADLRIEKILRPDLRVILERAGHLSYESSDRQDQFNRRLTLTQFSNGQKKEAVLVSDRKDDQIVGGVVYFSLSNGEALPKTWSGTKEAADCVDSFLKELTGR